MEFKSGKFNYKFDAKSLPLKRVIFLNASLVGFATELSVENQIVGVSSPEYVYSEKILNKIKSGEIEDVGNEQKYNLEKIIALKPDAVFTNYIASFENTYQLLKQNGIQIIFLDEYLEQKPLEKSKYLILFGQLFKKETEANLLYNSIEANFFTLEKLAQKNKIIPTVLANEMYGNQWFLPGGKSQLAHYLKSANSVYINKDNSSESAIPLSFEEIFVKAQNAKIWVNVGNHHTKKELLMINPNYAKMNIFNQGKIYSITGKEKNKANDFFESGVVRADLVLQDYVKILHPALLKDKELIYLKELR
ncbi:ABC transporter substrate-binding protein [Frigoriflavimonas asaccharolytica]